MGAGGVHRKSRARDDDVTADFTKESYSKCNTTRYRRNTGQPPKYVADGEFPLTIQRQR